MEHADQSTANTWFNLGPVSGDLDLSVRVPRIAQPSGPVEGKSVGRHPLDLEGFSKRLWCAGARVGGIVALPG